MSQNNSDNAPIGAENAPEESLMSHLLELRSRVMKASLALVLVFAALMVFPGQKEIFNLLFHPMVDALAGGKIIVTDPIDSFMIPIKLTLLVSFFIALPIVLYQAYGLLRQVYTNTRKHWQSLSLCQPQCCFLRVLHFAILWCLQKCFRFLEKLRLIWWLIRPTLPKCLVLCQRCF